ncbi:hypothetical protein WA026_002524 [Henosepilachna vigintioctopunctata]|uniref:Ionotropic receptor n=1 Tax=Henosepilachna vigintioctopunctata TaxID=420089 RepID=A0AAW1U1D6_9CUCU
MLKPLLALTKLICINYIVKNQIDHGKNAVVVDYEFILNFPLLQMNQKNVEVSKYHLPIPSVYIVNLNNITMTTFFGVRNVVGFDVFTKYIFIGSNFTYKPERDLFTFVFKDTVFINSLNGDIFLTSINTNSNIKEKMGNCFVNEQNLVEIFPTHLIRPKNVSVVSVCFHGLPPYVICTECEKKGIEIEIYTMLFSLINMTGYFSKNEIPRNKMQSLLEYKLDAGKCEVLPGLLANNDFGFTYTYLFDTLHWVVHVPEEIPLWQYAFKIFSPYIWITWILSSTSLSIVWYLTLSNKNSSNLFMTLTNGAILIVKLFIEQPNASHSTYLLSGFIFEDAIDSFDGIMENKLTLDIVNGAIALFIDDQKTMTYFGKYQVFNKSANWDYIGGERNIATLCTNRRFLYILQKHLDENGRPILEMIDAPVISIFVTTLLRKGNPISNILNAKLSLMNEHGFLSHISSKYEVRRVKKNASLNVRKLNIHNIELPIILWLTGSFISFICFLCELKKSKKK